MASIFAGPNWFALRVRPNHEQTAERGLLIRGLEVYLPKQRVHRHWSDRIKQTEAVLFPGYVFCRFGYQDRLNVLNSTGVKSIVAPAVEESEIDAIKKEMSILIRQ